MWPCVEDYIYNQTYGINFLIMLFYELTINLRPQRMTTFYIIIKMIIFFYIAS